MWLAVAIEKNVTAFFLTGYFRFLLYFTSAGNLFYQYPAEEDSINDSKKHPGRNNYLDNKGGRKMWEKGTKVVVLCGIPMTGR